MNIVDPKSDYLRDIYLSLKKRSKSLKHRGGTLSCERILEKEADGDLEKLEIQYTPVRAKSGTQMRLYVWADRWVWVDARSSAKSGWLWERTVEGRATGVEFGKKLIFAFEDSLDLFASKSDPEISFYLIWKPILSDGTLKVVN